MKYYVESGLKIPTFTKGWKLGRFITGMVFGIFSIWPTSHFYKRNMAEHYDSEKGRASGTHGWAQQ